MRALDHTHIGYGWVGEGAESGEGFRHQIEMDDAANGWIGGRCISGIGNNKMFNILPQAMGIFFKTHWLKLAKYSLFYH